MSEIATINPSQELVATLRSEQFQTEIIAALPPDVTPAKFVRTAITALQASPDIIKCDRATILRALIISAQMGLMPDGREAALVNFGGNAVLLPMVGGYRKIAAEHGWSIRSAVVFANDVFEYELGLELKLTHRPAGLREERGQVVGAYAIATHKDGRKELEVMTAAEIEKVRQVSRSKDRGPWKDWFERMVEKTPVRRLFPKLALDSKDAQPVRMLLEAARDAGPNGAADLLYGPDGHAHPVTPALSPPVDAPTAATPTVGGDDAIPLGDDQAPGSGTGGQQADDVAEAASSAPDPSEEEAEPEVGKPFPIPDKVIDQAAATIVPKGVASVKGKALSVIAAEEDGNRWLGWALKTKPHYWPEPFRASLELFVEHRVPEVWATFVAEREAT